MRLSKYRKNTIEKLTCAGVERPAYVVDLLISKIAGVSREYLIAHPEYEISYTIQQDIQKAVSLRLERMPLSYILNEAEFYGYKIKVGQGCLIPRPETELLVEAMLELAPQNGYFADWCTGSGCIAITMLLEREDLSGAAVDASDEALFWAGQNSKLYGLENRLALIKNANPSTLKFDKKFDFIVANPPYIPEDEISCLMKDVLEYEPHIALNGGAEGVEVYKLLFDALPSFVKQGGYIGFEIAGDRHAEILKEIAPKPLAITREIRDYNGILRHLIWRVL